MKTDTPETHDAAGLPSRDWEETAARLFDCSAKFERECGTLRQKLEASERELKERGVDIQELTTALQIEREENARLQSAINAFADQYREVNAWHDAPLIKRLFDLSRPESEAATKGKQ